MKSIAPWFCLLLGMICFIGPRFTSPELTETQLMMEYWDTFLQGGLWCLLGYWIID